MNIGPYTLSPIETGYIWLDGGAMFGTVPRVFWEKPHPPDDKNRIRLAMRALLLQGEGKNILVDCGNGDKGGGRFKEFYNLDQETANLEKSLKARSLSCGDITDVVLSHLHFDHAGAATTAINGEYRPTFPNATYYLQGRNLETAKSPNLKERASYLSETYEALVASGKLKLLDGASEIFSGVDLLISEGHTQAQQHIVVRGDKKTLFYCGDIIPTPAHLAIPWIAGYDLHPMTMLKEKEEILSKAVVENWILFYEHDPKIPATYVRKGTKHYEAGEIVDFS